MASHLLQSESAPPGQAGEDLLFGVFRAAGWKVALAPAGKSSGDALISKAKAKYAIVLKAASEGRRDRLVPLLSQAILEARSVARSRPTAGHPLAVVAAPRIPRPVAEGLLAFAAAHAPDVAVGVMDLLGLRAFAGPGLESLNGRPKAHGAGPALASEPHIHLFSDLNQWMLKVLLARHIPRDELLSGKAPGGDFKNASELARAANVSVMSAFRLLRQLDREGFLGEGRDVIRIVRLEALLRRWQAASLRPVPEVGVRRILPGSRQKLQRLMGRLGDHA